MKEIFKLMKLTNKSDFIKLLFIRLIYITIFIIAPLEQQYLIDSAVAKNYNLFLIMVGIVIFTTIFADGVGYIKDLIRAKCERGIWVNIVTKSEKNIKYFDSRNNEYSSGDIAQHLGQNYELIKNFICDYPSMTIIYFVEAVVILIILFKKSFLNGILLVIFVPLFILVSDYFADKLALYGDNVITDMGACRSYLNDLRSESLAERFRKKRRFIDVTSLVNIYKEDHQKHAKEDALFANFFSYALLNLLIDLSLIISAYQVFKGRITLGELSAIQLYVSHFWDPVESFIGYYKEYASVKEVIVKFNDFLEVPCLSYETKAISSIEISNYQSLGADNIALHNPLNIKLDKGKLYLVSGGNGSGKTTFIQALLGLTKRYCGSVAYESYGSNDNFVYSLAEPHASSYHINEEDNDVNKSLGQLKLAQLREDFKQEAAVYLFDEPTNYLDGHNKAHIAQSLNELVSKDKLVIVVTHDEDLIKELKVNEVIKFQ